MSTILPKHIEPRDVDFYINQTGRLPSEIKKLAADRYDELCVDSDGWHTYNGRVAALDFIEKLHNEIFDDPLYNKSETQIWNMAKEIRESIVWENTESLQTGIETCKRLMITVPATTSESMLKRFSDEKWWRLKIRRAVARRTEEVPIRLGLIHKGSHEYSSPNGQRRRRDQLDRNRKQMSKHYAVSEHGIATPMSDIIKTNESVRQALLTSKLKGLTTIQDVMGYDAGMITVTAPPRMHPSASTYDGTTPRQSADYLSHVIATSYRKMKREGRTVYGIQCPQPHKDSCAHFHVGAFGQTEDILRFYEVIREIALRTDSDAEGSEERRVDLMVEDRSKGRLSSYIARYVSRNAQINNDDSYSTRTGTEEDTWYASHGIRRYSFFGLPDDHFWFASRKMNRSTARENGIKALHGHAETGDYGRWCIEMGGVCLKQSEYGESIRSEYSNKYGEKAFKYVGSVVKGAQVIIKSTRYIISRCKNADLLFIIRESNAGRKISLKPAATGPPEANLHDELIMHPA